MIKNSVNSGPFSNSISSLNGQQNLGSNLHRVGIEKPQESYLDKSILIQSEISLVCLWISSKMKQTFLISETKIDNSFPISQFTMTGYSIPFRLDRTSHGGGILLFVREDIPCKIIKTDCDADFEGIFVEINLRKKMVTLLYLQST